jgi:cytochrome c
MRVSSGIVGAGAALAALAGLAAALSGAFRHAPAAPMARAVPAAAVQWNDLLRAADAREGAKIAKACMACHSFGAGEPRKVGPNLFGIVGAQVARQKDFPYSEALLRLRDRIWTTDDLYEWLRDPAAYAPGTTMSFGGLLDPQDRMDLIAYLMTVR